MKNKIFTRLLILAFFFVSILSFSSKSFSADRLVIAHGGGVQQLSLVDPHQMASSFFILGNVFDFLCDFDLNGTLQPRLATSWKYSADYKTITFKLRKGVKFSSGDPFTAKDVVWSLNRVGTNQPPIKDQFKSAGFIKVEALDDYTVAVYLEKPSAVFLRQTLAEFYITSEKYYNRVGKEEFLKKPAGTGPYKIAEWKEGQYIDLDYNTNYWGKKPDVLEARVIVTADQNTGITMLKAGEVDLVTFAPTQSVDDLKKAGYNIVVVNGFGGGHAQAIQFCLINPDTPWSNLKVRQAINYAIDQDAVIKKVFAGIPPKVEWQYPWQLGYDPSMKAVYPYDPAKAKKLMAEAGYEKGFDFPITVISDVTGLRDIADYVATALKAININVKITGMSFGPQYFELLGIEARNKASRTGAILHEAGGPGNPDPAVDLMYTYYSLKNGLFVTPELDAAIQKALVTPNDAQRAKLIRQAYKIVNDNMPMVPICGTVLIYVMKPDVSYVSTQNIASKTGIIKDIKRK